MTSRADLRKKFRQMRRALSDQERNQAAFALFNHFKTHRFFRNCRNIAVYLPNDGEIDLWPLIHLAWRRGKNVYLPALHQPGLDRMHFLRFEKKSRLVKNRFGIDEPRFSKRKLVNNNALDLVLMPLVAFDGKGNRLGMGGGYYDRTFASLSVRTHWNKPRLVGTAYDFQYVDALESEPWDVPLDAVVTPTKVFNLNV